MRPLTALVLLLSCAVLTGCGGNPFFRARAKLPEGLAWSATAGLDQPLRIAVLPTEPGPGVGRSGAAFHEHLAASLRARGQHEVILVPATGQDAVLPGALERGRLPTSALLRLRERLGADAVLLSRVEQLEAFAPISAGVSIHLVSCLDGGVLWSVTAHVDTADAAVQEDIQAWFRDTQGAATTSLAGWRTATESPREFLRYLADRAASTCTAPPVPHAPR